MPAVVRPLRHAHHVLIVALLASIGLTIALGSDAPFARWFWRALPIGAAVVLLRRRRHTMFALAVAAGLAGLAVDAPLGWLAVATSFGLTMVVLLGEVFERDVVTGDTVSAALCAYLMLGVTFTVLFAAVHAADDAAFGGAIRGGDVPGLLHFSFVTLTTVGYGDIAPVSGPARALAVLEALLGQLFLVSVVAQLVSRRASGSAARPGG